MILFGEEQFPVAANNEAFEALEPPVLSSFRLDN